MYCCYKTNKTQYKYGLLGDDSVDSDKSLYEFYHQVLLKLGVQISTTKCTTSSSGSVEFAKRLFRKGREITGLPVYLLQYLDRYPEQTLELIKICRQRGYTDKRLGPVVVKLIDTLPKVKNQLLDLLSLPKSLTNNAPLLEVRAGSYAEFLLRLSESDQKAYLAKAQDLVFWNEVERLSLLINKGDKRFNNKVKVFKVSPTHPLVFALSNRMDQYLGIEPDDCLNNADGLGEGPSEYSIYDAWIRGDYRYMANLPSLDTYKYYSRGHKATKCKFLVLKQMLELVITTDTHKFLRPLARISDFDLYDILFENLNKNLGRTNV